MDMEIEPSRSLSLAPGFRDPRTGPLFKLTTDLVNTYKRINTVYFAKQDENRDYVFKRGDVFKDQYELQEPLGKGSFGQVVRAWDRMRREFVALKIIKNKKPFYNQALIEIKLLKLLNQQDPEDQQFIVRMLDHFVHQSHQCLVFELLSFNLYELSRSTHFHGLSLTLIRKFAYQILRALLFLSSPDVNIIHCDLKPENILLRNRESSAIKIIDFGSSCHGHQRMYKYIQSRFYRAPEVLLELDYGKAIDMWGLGCILIELHTGEPVFAGENELDQLSKITEVLGLPPDEMVLRSPRAKLFFSFTKKGQLWTYKLKHKPGWRERPLNDLLGVHTGGPGCRRRGEEGHNPNDYYVFIDLVKRMLTYNPAERIKPLDALNHEFFQIPVMQYRQTLVAQPPLSPTPYPGHLSASSSAILARCRSTWHKDIEAEKALHSQPSVPIGQPFAPTVASQPSSRPFVRPHLSSSGPLTTSTSRRGCPRHHEHMMVG